MPSVLRLKCCWDDCVAEPAWTLPHPDDGRPWFFLCDDHRPPAEGIAEGWVRLFPVHLPTHPNL